MADSLAFDEYCEKLIAEFEDYEEADREIIERLPDFLRLFANLLCDIDVPRDDRLRINATIGYVLAPYDVKPESVEGPEGYIDDAFICLYVLNGLIDSLGERVLREAWSGEDDVIDLVESLYNKSEHRIDEIEKKSIFQYTGFERR